MNEHDAVSSVWSRYRQANQIALSEPAEPEDQENMSLEELEQAIAQAAAASGIPETGMPPRAVVHPVKRPPVSVWFYTVLVILFVALVTGMIWWGRNM